VFCARSSLRTIFVGTPRDHGIGNDCAFRAVRSRRDPAADDSPAKISLAPEPAGFIDALADVFARAEHKQQVGRLQRRLDQVPCVDIRDFGLGRQSRASIGHGLPV